MIKKLKGITQIIGFAVLVVLIAWVFNQLKKQGERVVVPQNQADFVIEEKTYTPPIIKLPFIKDKQPVKTERLPIPKKDIDKTVAIETVSLEGEKQETILIIDKEGQIYKATDTPVTTKVEVVKWKPKFFEPDFEFGYSLVYGFGDRFYHCLSLEYFRLGSFYVGSEIGLGFKDAKFGNLLVGLSGKYKFAEISEPVGDGSSIGLSLLVGWNFLGKKPYVGINMRW